MSMKILSTIGKGVSSLRSWIATDGLLHIIASMAVFFWIALWGGLETACILTAFVGVAKEMFDIIIKGQKPCANNLHDLVCDAIGIGLSVPLFFLAMALV